MIKGSDKVKYIEESMEAILERDQRTTSHRVFDCCENFDHCLNYNMTNDRRNNIDNHDNFEVSMTDKNNFNFHKCKNIRKIQRINNITDRYFNSTILQRLVFSVILMLLVIPVQSAPARVSLKEMNRRLAKTPAWKNPCGSEIERDGQFQVDNERNMTDDFENTVGPTLSLIRQATSHAEKFRDKFLRATLQVGPQEATISWGDMRLDWLPKYDDMPKHLGTLLPPEYFEKLETRMIDEIFVNAYNYLQIYSVGIEQIVWDQQDRRSDFYDNFETVRTQVLAILCELHIILMSRGVLPKEPPSRSLMPQEARVADETYLVLRDWIIFRDYMNSLEFFTQIFEHILFMLQE